MDPAFSRRGEHPTTFERELLANHATLAPRTDDDLWLMLGKRIGAESLLVVLDELGSLKLWVPTREQLVRRVWLAIRDREIQRLRDEQHLTTNEICLRLGVKPRTVRRVVHRRPVSAAPIHAKQRA